MMVANHRMELYKGERLKSIILGGQDGLVNVLGIILGVATATASTKIVLIAGFSATFAESISMAAVAYTSSKAIRDFYDEQKRKIPQEITPLRSAFIVGISAIIGSLIPLFPFLLLSFKMSLIASMLLSAFTLFSTGVYRAKLTRKDWKKEGTELTLIGIISAVTGFAVGLVLEWAFR